MGVAEEGRAVGVFDTAVYGPAEAGPFRCGGFDGMVGWWRWAGAVARYHARCPPYHPNGQRTSAGARLIRR